MWWEFDIIVPAGTPETNKHIETLDLTYGTITYFEIMFPTGCKGRVLATINDGLHQLWPTNPESSIKGDGMAIGGRVEHKLSVVQPGLDIHAWSPNALYQHTITVRFWITPKRIWPFSEEWWALREAEGA